MSDMLGVKHRQSISLQIARQSVRQSTQRRWVAVRLVMAKNVLIFGGVLTASRSLIGSGKSDTNSRSAGDVCAQRHRASNDWRTTRHSSMNSSDITGTNTETALNRADASTLLAREAGVPFQPLLGNTSGIDPIAEWLSLMEVVQMLCPVWPVRDRPTQGNHWRLRWRPLHLCSAGVLLPWLNLAKHGAEENICQKFPPPPPLACAMRRDRAFFRTPDGIPNVSVR